MKKVILFALFLFVIISCKSKNVVTETTVSATPEVSMADMIAQGENIYVNKCGTCHALPKVKDYTPENWKPILLRMQKEAGISDTEREYVYKYIVMQ
jgi:cytochrome c5